MPLGPVFELELASAARRRRSYVLRCVYALGLLAVIGAAIRGAPDASELGRLARRLFERLVVVQGLAILALTPALVAGAIAREVQRKTLYALLTSDLTSTEIVAGKLGARLLHVAVLVACGVPILIGVGLAGGLPPWVAILAALATLSSAFFVASLSILASTQTRSVRGALNLTYTVAMAWLILPCATDALWPRSSWGLVTLNAYVIRPLNAWMIPTTPFALWLDAQRGAIHGPGDLAARVGWMVGLQTTYGSALLALAVACLRPMAHTHEGGRRRSRRATSAAALTTRRPPCGDDPMLWKELFAPRVATFHKHLGLAIALALAGLLVWGTIRFAAPAFGELWESGYGIAGIGSARARFLLYLRIVGTGIYLVYALGVVSDAAAGLAAERENDTWISLVSTPLTGTEIIRAKMLGAIWGIRHTAAVLVVLWLAGVASGAVHPLALPVVLVELAAFTWFAAALGSWVSLHAKDAMRAVALAALILLGLNSGSLVITRALWPGRPCGSLGCSPFVLAASLASYADLHGRRSHAVLGLVSDDGLSALWTEQGTELALTCGTCVLAYALAAWVLTRATCRSFDRQLDRPAIEAQSLVDAPASSATPPKPHVGSKRKTILSPGGAEEASHTF